MCKYGSTPRLTMGSHSWSVDNVVRVFAPLSVTYSLRCVVLSRIETCCLGAGFECSSGACVLTIGEHYNDMQGWYVI
jgi:hypothetical protein